MTGWLKIYRRLVDWEWYSDTVVTRVFLHLLITANFEDKKYLGHSVSAGSCVIGRKELAENLGFSEQNIRTALAKLKSTNEITIKTTNKFTIIQIVNWGSYQESTSNLTNNQPTTNQQLTTPKEYKKERNKESVGTRFSESGLIVSDETRQLWKLAYPDLDIDKEIRKAFAWLKANPSSQKSNFDRFLVNWFSRAIPNKNNKTQAHDGAMIV